MNKRRLIVLFSSLISVLLMLILAAHARAEDAYMESALPKYPVYPEINFGTGSRAELLKRGEYLVTLGDCIACHSAPGGKSFAGGLPIKTPFGTIYSPNITPDKKNGIGNWTEKDFIKAMREGVSPKGHFYLPAFPYLYFNKVNDDDLLAIKAYLDEIPAVDQPNKKNELMFPFNIRFLQLGWRILFFYFEKTGPYKPNPKQTASWNRGAYIVEGLGHCGMCHSPMYTVPFFSKLVLGAPIKKYCLTGGFVEGYYAPNITHANLKDCSIQDLDDVFLKDRLIGGGTVQGPMAEANHNSLQYLDLDDLHAIGDYLRTIKNPEQPKPRTGSGLKAGKQVFEQHCANCHVTGAGGAPKIGDAESWGKLVQKVGLNELYTNAINGIRGMPAMGGCRTCTNTQIQDAVQYIVSQSKPETAQILGLAPKKPQKPLTLEDGKKIYTRYCQACHNGSYEGAPVLGNKQQWAPRIAQGMETLILHSIKGFNNMPKRGSCCNCRDAEIKAAVVYMVQESKTSGDYSLWLKS